jgi:hypothetical protein
MCIVIDTNAFAPVFNDNCEAAFQFAPIKDWILSGNGFIVFGGSKYRRELKKSYRYLRLIRELKKIRKAVEVSKSLIDSFENNLKIKTANTQCNDQHIIAIFCVSKCLLFCSNDSSFDKFLKNKAYYPKGQKIPKIYRSLKNKALVDDKYITKIQNTIN